MTNDSSRPSLAATPPPLEQGPRPHPEFPPALTERDVAASPFAQLWSLFRGETREIRTLVVFSVVVGLLSLATPIAVEALVNTVAFVGPLQPIVVLAIVLTACLTLAAAILALEAVLIELMQRRVFVRVAAHLAAELPRTSLPGLDGRYGPELANRFFDVILVQKIGAKLLLDGLAVVLSAAVGLVVLAFYHPLLLAFDVVLLGLLAVVIFVLGRGSVRTAIAESGAKYATADWIEELLRHPYVFRGAAGRRLAADRAGRLAGDYIAKRRTHYRVVFRQLVCALALQVVMSALLLGLGGWLVKAGQLTLGQLVASWLIISLVLAAVQKLGRQLESVYDILAAARKLGVLFELPRDRSGGVEPEAPDRAAALELIGLADPRVVLPADRPHSLKLEPGRSLAIVGPGGSGKTSLLEFLHGLRAPAQGRIEWDGVSLASLRPDSVWDQIGIARAGDVLSGTVAENVGLERDGVGLSEIRRALSAVGLWETVQRLPEGLGTRLASFGAPLSATQADRLVLARGIAARPRLLLVDGLLDGLQERDLDAALAALLDPRASWTLVLATQHDSIAARCDEFLRLEGPACATGSRREEEAVR